MELADTDKTTGNRLHQRRLATIGVLIRLLRVGLGALLVVAFIQMAGCDRGPALGTVKGTITIDRTPVDGGLIRMVPTDGNSQPADSVITGGNYSITMPMGEKRVQIYWAQGGGGNVDTASQGTEKSVVQRIPAKYNAESTLTYTVEKGQAVKDFALSSH